MGIDNIKTMEELLQAMSDEQKKRKVIKSDRGLFERTESSKVILTEDNKQVLMD